MYKYFPFKELEYKAILLYGFHFTFMLVLSLAVYRDIILTNYINATINSISFCLTVFSYYILHVKHRNLLSTYLLMTIAIIPLLLLIYINKFENLPIIYFIVLPLATFFLLNFQQAIKLNILIYISVISLLYIIYQENPNTPILNNNLALINLAFASILITGFGTFYHLSIESTLNALVSSNQQKDILLKEVHHRVKNNLNIISSILNLQSHAKSDETQEELLKSKSRIESIAVVHEMLYKHDDYEKINFNEYVNKLSKLILLMLNTPNKIILNLDKSYKLSLPLDAMIQLGLVINEMIINTIKYAHNNNGVIISMSLKKKNNIYTFLYKDNGQKNLNTSEVLSNRGLGLQLIELSSKQLDGDLYISYDNGLQYQIKFQND